MALLAQGAPKNVRDRGIVLHDEDPAGDHLAGEHQHKVRASALRIGRIFTPHLRGAGSAHPEARHPGVPPRLVTQGSACRVESGCTCLGHASAVPPGAPRSQTAPRATRSEPRSPRGDRRPRAAPSRRARARPGRRGVYLGFVFYVGWDGGRSAEWLQTGLATVVGRIAYVVPIAVAGWGAALIMRPFGRRRAL